MLCLIKIFCKSILLLLLVNTLNFGQDTIKVLIFKFQDISLVEHKYSDLKNLLPEEIVKNLNDSKEYIFEADFYDSQSPAYTDSIPDFSGRPSNEIITTVRKKLITPFDFIVLGTFQYEKMNILTVDGYLFNVRSGVEEYRFRVDEFAVDRSKKDKPSKLSQDIARDLAIDVQKELEFYWVGRIRIGVLPFTATDKLINQEYEYLEEAIPSMLISFLSGSGRFKLIETKLDKEINELLRMKDTLNRLDTRKITEKYRLNYIVTGEYFKMEEKLRVDVRCIGRTGEILFSDGFILNEVDLNILSSTLQELSARMRPIIEKDFSKQLIETESLAVVAFPPTPLNRSTSLRSNYIRKTLVNKFRLIKELRIKDDEEKIAEYLNRKEDKFRICTDLGVGNLLSIQCEEFENGSIMIYYDLFAIDKPTLELIKDSKYVDADSVDNFINNIFFTSLQNLRIDTSKSISSVRRELEEIKFPTYLDRWTIGLKGSSIIRADGQVYLSDGIGDYWEGFLTYHLNDRSKLEFQLGYDLGKKSKTDSGEEIRVSSVLLGALYKYEFLRLLKIGFYGGAGLTFIWAYRGFENLNGTTEEKGTAAPGLTFLTGMEIKITNIGLSIFLEPRYILTTTISEGKTSTGFVFPGGRLGGFYLTLGVGYNFNLEL